MTTSIRPIAVNPVTGALLYPPLEITSDGAASGARVGGGTAAGPPTTGTWAIGDMVIDQAGTSWVCIFAGTPGVWVEVGSRPGTVHYALQDGWHPVFPTGASADLTVTADRAYAIPLRVDRSATITGVAVHVGTAGTGSTVVRMGLYFDTGSNGPGTRIADWGTVAAITTGAKVISSLSQGIVGGTQYWLVVAVQTVTGTPALKTRNISHPQVVETATPTTLATHDNAYFANGVTGALPSSFGAVGGIAQGPSAMVKLQ